MNWECETCGMINESDAQDCLKCGEPVRIQLVDKTHSVDIAHSGEDWQAAKAKIDKAIDFALRNRYKRLRIIHGHGSEAGHTGIIRDHAVPYLRECARRHGAKLIGEESNKGAHTLQFDS